jgi:hypothetical protein
MTEVLNVKDVLSDAHNTFILSSEAVTEQEMQLETMVKQDNAFNWSDDDILEDQPTASETIRSYSE